MEITAISRSPVFREFLEVSAKLLAQELKIKNSTYSLKILTKSQLRKHEGMRGVVFKIDDKQLVMILDSNLGFESTVLTLAHEMVHVKQFARGQLKPVIGRNKYPAYTWLGKKCRAKYFDQPWEIEAFKKERILANKIFAIVC
jgi:hypothetical protein